MNTDKQIQELQQLKIPSEDIVKDIRNKVKQIFLQQSNLQCVPAPVTVCGDIHGQFYDLMKIFQEAGALPDTSYIFIGDFVDRGYNSIETLFFLLLLKIKCPKRITLLRGNHQSRQVSSMYGFYEQINAKYGNIAMMFLISYLSQHQLTIKFFVSMEDYLLILKGLIKFERLIENHKLILKVLFVTQCGQIPKTLMHGLQIKEVQDIYMVREQQINFVIQIIQN